MDIGSFVSYELSSNAITTKLFRFIKLNSIPLYAIEDFRLADKEEITRLHHLNWFSFIPWNRPISNLYTLQASEKSPRIFMRLSHGSHLLMREMLSRLSALKKEHRDRQYQNR